LLQADWILIGRAHSLCIIRRLPTVIHQLWVSLSIFSLGLAICWRMILTPAPTIWIGGGLLLQNRIVLVSHWYIRVHRRHIVPGKADGRGASYSVLISWFPLTRDIVYFDTCLAIRLLVVPCMF
jgi:hypothetical protein